MTDILVTQSGNPTIGHAVVWVAPGVVGDAGAATGKNYLNTLGITANGGLPFVIASSDPTISTQYSTIGMGISTNSGYLNCQSYGSSSVTSFSLNIGGSPTVVLTDNRIDVNVDTYFHSNVTFTNLGVQIYKGNVDITAPPPSSPSTGWTYYITTGGAPNTGYAWSSPTPTIVSVGDNIVYNGTTWDWHTNVNISGLANLVYATPNGSSGTASLRSLVAADVPTLNQNTTGTAASCTGNALTASTLQTPRNINGVGFNGSTNITIYDTTKENIIATGTTAQYWRGDKSWQNLATVATTGSYNDLSNQPSIPAPQVQTNWNATSGMGQLLNKPVLGTASAKDIAISGNASATEVVMGNDTRLVTLSHSTISTALGYVPIASFNLGTAAFIDIAPLFYPVTPLMDSVASVGISTAFARADHIHPTDTSLVPKTTSIVIGTGLTGGGALNSNVSIASAYNYRPVAPFDLGTAAFVDIYPLQLSTTPLMNGTATIGDSTAYARANHIHPIDTSRAPITSPVFAGTVTASVFLGDLFGKANTASLSSIASYASTSSLTSIALYANVSSLASIALYADVASLSSIASIANYSPISSLASIAVYSNVASLASIASIANYSSTSSIASIALYTNVSSIASISNYTPIASLASVALYANISSLASIASYAPVCSIASTALAADYASVASIASVTYTTSVASTSFSATSSLASVALIADYASSINTSVVTTALGYRPLAPFDVGTAAYIDVAPLFYPVTPLMNGVVSVGTSTAFSRADHIHPIDTSRAPLASPNFSGTVSATAFSGTILGTVSMTSVASLAYYANASSLASITSYAPISSLSSVSLYANVSSLASIATYSPTSSLASVALYSNVASLASVAISANSVAWSGISGKPAILGGPYIDVTQSPYNADNTGATDCSTAIQSAINAAAGKTVFFPAGQYKLDTGLTYNPGSNFGTGNNLCLLGAGNGNTIINYTGSGTALFYGQGSATQSYLGKIEGIFFQGPGHNNSIGLQISSVAWWVLRDCVFYNFQIGLQLYDAITASIDACQFHQCVYGVSGNGVYISPPNLLNFTACRFNSNSLLGVYLQRASGICFTGCDFENNGTTTGTRFQGAIVLNNSPNDGYGLFGVGPGATFTGCWFEGNIGQADICITGCGYEGRTGIVVIGCNFIRFGNTNYVTFNVLADSLAQTSNYITMLVMGCGFNGFNGYVPNAAHPYIYSTNATYIWTTYLCNNWVSPIEVPVPSNSGFQ